ncbi:Iron-sulfur cluster repair protein ScdA [compost metagenome]
MAELQQHFDKDMMVRDIVLRFPKSADFFRNRKIDFCCGGNRPLQEAAEEGSLSIEQLLSDLTELAANHPQIEESEDWTKVKSEELIEHIVRKHHQYLREELPEIQKSVTKVARVHGGSEEHLLEMERLFGLLRNELLEHIEKEEAQVFPKMINWGLGQEQIVLEKLRSAIHELEDEHTTAGDILKSLRELTNDYLSPAHACTTYRTTYARLEELEGMTFMHVHLENNILFPRYL